MERLEEYRETLRSVGSVFTVWEFVACLLLNKTLLSMWSLINNLQFLVYIGQWQINYTDLYSQIIQELGRITLGQFFEDFEFGDKIMTSVGIEPEKRELGE